MTIARARKLRRSMPPAEARMWNLLRKEPFRSFHFRRQVPLGRYYTDFASHRAKLVIEIDGDTHGTDAALAYDRLRDEFIRGQGYGVLRVFNSEVIHNMDGVATLVLLTLGEPLSQASGE